MSGENTCERKEGGRDAIKLQMKGSRLYQVGEDGRSDKRGALGGQTLYYLITGRNTLSDAVHLLGIAGNRSKISRSETVKETIFRFSSWRDQYHAVALGRYSRTEQPASDVNGEGLRRSGGEDLSASITKEPWGQKLQKKGGNHSLLPLHNLERRKSQQLTMISSSGLKLMYWNVNRPNCIHVPFQGGVNNFAN